MSSEKDFEKRKRWHIKIGFFIGFVLVYSTLHTSLGEGANRYRSTVVIHMFETIFHALGGVMFVCGVFFRVAGICTLGAMFVSDVRNAGTVVNTGVYHWMRHPSDYGLLAIALGAPLLLEAPLTAAVSASILLPISLWRIRREEDVLVNRTGPVDSLSQAIYARHGCTSRNPNESANMDPRLHRED